MMKRLSAILLVLLAWAGTASAAITRNPQGQNNGGFTTATSIPVSLGVGVKNADIVWVAITRNVQTALTPPSGYTCLTARTFGSVSSLNACYHKWSTGDSTLVTFTSGSTTGSWATAAYTGADPTPTLSTAASQANGAATTATSPTITPVTSTDMLLMIYGAAAAVGQAYSAPSEGTIAATDISSSSAAIVDLLLASAAATGPQTVTLAASAANAGFQVSMAPISTPTATATTTATPTTSATPTPTTTATPSTTPTPSATPTPTFGGSINAEGQSAVPVTILACASGTSKVLAGKASRSHWAVLPESGNMRCMLGTTQDVGPTTAPSATAGFLFEADALMYETTLQRAGSAVATQRMDCCGVSGAVTVDSWEE